MRGHIMNDSIYPIPVFFCVASTPHLELTLDGNHVIKDGSLSTVSAGPISLEQSAAWASIYVARVVSW